MQFSGHMPKFECQCGKIELGGAQGTLVVNGQLMLECGSCSKIYRFDCRLEEQTFTREDLRAHARAQEGDDADRGGA